MWFRSLWVGFVCLFCCVDGDCGGWHKLRAGGCLVVVCFALGLLVLVVSFCCVWRIRYIVGCGSLLVICAALVLVLLLVAVVVWFVRDWLIVLFSLFLMLFDFIGLDSLVGCVYCLLVCCLL